VHPQAESAPPKAEQESNFLGKWGNWGDLGAVGEPAVLACVLRATTKKGRQLFGGIKMHPRQNFGYAYDLL